MIPIICFTSDFGLDDTWVGVCHATIVARCPTARVVDMSHGIAPYDVRAGAIAAASAAFQLPWAIHMAVVDPDVGGARRALCLVTASGTVLLGPDNGVLLPAALRVGGIGHVFKLDTGGAAPTFHARDVFARAAGDLASGAEPSDIGVEIDIGSLAPAPFGICEHVSGYVLGEVLGADRFGSLRLNVPIEQLGELGLISDELEIDVGHNSLTVLRGRTYSDVAEGDPVALGDSSGWLTLAINRGSAEDRYSVAAGARVRLRACELSVRPAE